MSQQNIIMNNKYQWQQRVLQNIDSNTKIPTMTITAIPFHKQSPNIKGIKKNSKIKRTTKSGIRYHKQQHENPNNKTTATASQTKQHQNWNNEQLSKSITKRTTPKSKQQ